jgi:hypothetical protein
VLLNNGGGDANVTCDAACFAALGAPAGTSYTLRDLWAHADLGVLSPPLTRTVAVPSSGQSRAFKLTPTAAPAAAAF